ncbi:MAG TPA: CoA transferase [Acetobacteraceae bacterium]|jgi:crotonobetainyl-CoA:carnitine CoA-transferase CaiB-like acyl-CoA transferase|nr:CoA transferase [Acetobacteraceae bacterium]
MSYAAPYAGLKVVDLSQGVAGPYCAMLLAQYGANVIKVEPTETGDWSRGLGVIYGDHTAYSIPSNLGKRSIALDLKSPEGRDVLWRLIAGVDVFLQGFRPGVIERMGFGYDTVSEREPRIIYLSVSGFGQAGPLAERPAMDPVLQAFTGLIMENKGEDGIPHRVPIVAIDTTTGLFAFTAVAAALHARRDAAHGRHIEASLMQSAAALQVVRMLQSHLEGAPPRAVSPPSGVFRTSNDWINVTVARQHEWIAYCDAIDHPDLATDPRFTTSRDRLANAETLMAVVRPIIATRSFDDWSQRFVARKVMHERVNTYATFLAHEQAGASGAVSRVSHPGVERTLALPNLIGLPAFEDATPRAISPSLGEHTEAILCEHGYTPAEITALAERGVVKVSRNRSISNFSPSPCNNRRDRPPTPP